MFAHLLLTLAFLHLTMAQSPFLVTDSRMPLRRRLFYGPSNTSLSIPQVERRQLLQTELKKILPTDTMDMKLESGANLWQQSLNASLANFNEANGALKANEIAHSEPLKLDRPNKDKVEESSLDNEDEENLPAGTTKAPVCSVNSGKHYCSYKENYPTEIVSKITKYYKYPLESIFKDLQKQVMPTLAQDSAGGLVCDSTTRLLRVGWAMNTNARWLVVLNTEHYQQYVSEVLCRYQSGSTCNFVPPCYQAKCLQRYNTQKLLVIDPAVPHRGPFLSEFIFPSCCVCHIEADKSYLLEGKKRA